MANEQKKNDTKQDAPKDSKAAPGVDPVLAALDPEQARIAAEAQALEDEAEQEELARRAEGGLPARPLEGQTGTVPTLEEWIEGGGTRSTYLASFGSRATPNSPRAQAQSLADGGGRAAELAVLNALPEAQRKQLLERARNRGQLQGRGREEYPGDIVVTCLKNNPNCRLGDRRYVLQAGHELFMNPSHAIELGQSGWIAPVRVQTVTVPQAAVRRRAQPIEE